MDKINPFRNPEDDNLVDTIRAVLSGKPIEEAEMDSVNPKAVKKKFKDRKDKDIDNDGDVDDSDKFLHKRRKAISKAVAKEDTDDNPANRQHLCAKNVVHEEWGEGECIPTMHADPDKEGHVAWYDIMFEHGIETKVSIDELKVTKEANHTHSEKKKKKVEAAHDDEEGQDTDTEKDKKKDDKKVGKGKKDDIDTEPRMDNSKMVSEKEMTDDQKKKREEIVKSMKKDMPSFKKKYGDRAKDVMYATATKMAMK